MVELRQAALFDHQVYLGLYVYFKNLFHASRTATTLKGTGVYIEANAPGPSAEYIIGEDRPTMVVLGLPIHSGHHEITYGTSDRGALVFGRFCFDY